MHESGSADGTGAEARFFVPIGLVADEVDHLYVADSINCAIREIFIATRQLRPLRGLRRIAGVSTVSAPRRVSGIRVHWRRMVEETFTLRIPTTRRFERWSLPPVQSRRWSGRLVMRGFCRGSCLLVLANRWASRSCPPGTWPSPTTRRCSLPDSDSHRKNLDRRAHDVRGARAERHGVLERVGRFHADHFRPLVVPEIRHGLRLVDPGIPHDRRG